MEIERKFLVKKMPDLTKYDYDEIKQGYTSRIRIRKAGKKYYLTIKGPGKISREETEISLTKKQFDTIWPLTLGKRLTKTRYYIPNGKHTIELDVYHGRNKALVTVEIEMKRENDRIIIPKWLGKEVTGQKKYRNYQMAY